MNILFIGSLDLQYPSRDGGVRRMLPLLEHIRKKRHKVIMVVPTMKSRDESGVFENFPVYHVGPARRKVLQSSYYFSGISLAVKTFIKIKKLVKINNIDVIYAFNPTLICGFPGYFAAKFCHKPLVLEMNDLVMNLGIEAGVFQPKSVLTKLGLLVQNKLPLHANMVITTNFINKMLLSQGMSPEKITVIPMAADIENFHPQKNGAIIRQRYGLSNAMIILYQGAVRTAFGIGVLLDAIAVVSQNTQTELKCLIVGFHRNREVEFDQDDEIISLKNKSKHLGINDSVIFTGPQPHEEIPDFIAAADICVNPAPYTIVHRAASPAKVFEYMAVGKPVISTNLESVANIIIDGETGLLAEPNEQSLAERILWLIENPAQRAIIGRKAREKVVAEYQWEKLGDKLIDAFKHTVANYHNYPENT